MKNELSQMYQQWKCESEEKDSRCEEKNVVEKTCLMKDDYFKEWSQN